MFVVRGWFERGGCSIRRIDRVLLLLVAMIAAEVTIVPQTQGQSIHANASPPPCPPVPSYKLHRQDEDWNMMRDPSCRIDWSDNWKYLRLGKREDWYASVGGESRSYYERYVNQFWGSRPQDLNGYLLQRFMVHGDFHLSKRFRLFGELKSGTQIGELGCPCIADEDFLDVHQAFVDLAWDFTGDRRLTLRAGYEELDYGSGRLISSREGRNVRQSFAGAKLMFHSGQWNLDAFVSKPVATPIGFFDDAPISADTLWGVYAVKQLAMIPEGNLDLYYIGFGRRDATFDQGSGQENRQTLGTRFSAKPTQWDFNTEIIYQFGTFGSGNIRAWGIASDVGYTLQRMRFSPRVGLKANAASGDRDPNNPDLETFNPLFPRGVYFGQLISLGPLNFSNLHPTVTLSLPYDVSVEAHWVFFWRQSTMDGVYGIPGNLLRTGQLSQARFIAHEPGVEVRLPINRHTDIIVDYGGSFAGPFLRETPPGKNTTFLAAWVTYRF